MLARSRGKPRMTVQLPTSFSYMKYFAYSSSSRLNQNHLRQDDLKTWYTASGSQVLPNCLNDDTGLILTIFMAWPSLFPNASAWVKIYKKYFQACSAYPMHR